MLSVIHTTVAYRQGAVSNTDLNLPLFIFSHTFLAEGMQPYRFAMEKAAAGQPPFTLSVDRTEQDVVSVHLTYIKKHI